jgi:hypothetical protein
VRAHEGGREPEEPRHDEDDAERPTDLLEVQPTVRVSEGVELRLERRELESELAHGSGRSLRVLAVGREALGERELSRPERVLEEDSARRATKPAGLG